MFLLNVALNAPFFLPGEGKYRDSIEGGYAGMAHFVSQHPNPFGWNPIQYKGLPTLDWYPPLLPYTAGAAIRVLPFLKPEHVYRLVVVAMATLGPVTLFLFVLFFTRSRPGAAVAALLYTFLSIGYLVYPAITADRGYSYLPWRMQVLVKYGEGPHNVGLALLPLALIACWRACVGRRFAELAVAAALMAAVTMCNWIAAMALAWCVLMMLLAGAGSAADTGFLGRRLLWAAAIAYGFVAFWLTPQMIATTFFNWPADSFGYEVSADKYLWGAGLLVLPPLIRLVFLRAGAEWQYLCYLLLCLSGFAWVATLHYRYAVDVIPESRRYELEVELFAMAGAVELFRRIRHRRLVRDALFLALGTFVLSLVPQVWTYATNTWIMLRPARRERTIEYQVSERVAQLQPSGRVFVFGGTRFRFNSWFLIPQLGGTFETGLRNRGAIYAVYHLQRGYGRGVEQRGADAMNFLKANAVEYAVIHGPKSAEHWRDINNYRMLDGLAETVWRAEDDTIYRIPFRGMANLVRPNELPATRPFGPTAALLEPYVRALEDTTRPALKTDWDGPSAINISGNVGAGDWITLRVSWDAGWRAWQDSEPISVEADTMDNILIKARPRNASRIHLAYRPTWQRVAGTAVSLCTIAAVVLLLRRERRSLR